MTRHRESSAAQLALAWIPVALYAAMIHALSSRPNLNPPPLPLFPGDKVYHFVEFFLFGLLLARAWWVTLGGTRPLAVALAAAACGIVMGAVDELHQGFVPGRDADPLDLLADTAGVVAAQLAFRAIARG